MLRNLPRALRALPRSRGHRGQTSPSGRVEGRRRHERAASLSPAVPPACHKQRSRAVSSGQSRSLGEGPLAGHAALTWPALAPRNCMACKGSSSKDPSIPVPSLSAPEHRRVLRAEAPAGAPDEELESPHVIPPHYYRSRAYPNCRSLAKCCNRLAGAPVHRRVILVAQCSPREAQVL
jgi:hypothetical protein